MKRKFKSEYCEHCLEATHPKDRINHLEKIKLMCLVFEKIIKNF